MLHVYMFLKLFDEIRSKCTIDLSKIPSENLADECEQILQHHHSCVIFLGYLEPGWMLDPKHEARMRNTIRKFETHAVCFHPESIPFSWKNEIDTVYLKNTKDGQPETINDGCSILSESETEHE